MFEFPLADKFLFVAAISQTQEGCATKGATPEVVEITSEEGWSEVGEKPSTEAIVEEPMTEEPGVEQESPDDSIPKESGGEQGVFITLEGDGDQDGSSEDGSSGSESSPEGASFEYVKDLVLKAGSSSYTPLTPIPLASISVDPTSQSFGEGTQASRTVTPTSAFKSSDFPQVIPLSLNLTTPFLTSLFPD